MSRIVNSKIKASTLSEVLVALTIITLISAMFLTLVIKVGNYHSNRRKLIINQQLIEIAEEAKTYNYFDDELFEFESYYIQKTVTPYKEIDGVYELLLTAYKYNDIKLIELKSIVERSVINE